MHLQDLHIALFLLFYSHFLPACNADPTVTITDFISYKAEPSCAQDCIFTGSGGGLAYLISCKKPWYNDCYCPTATSSAVEAAVLLSKCVMSWCSTASQANRDWGPDATTAMSVYSSYCMTAIAAVSATSSVTTPTASPTQTAAPQSSGLSKGAKYGLGFGLSFGILLIIALLVFRKKVKALVNKLWKPPVLPPPGQIPIEKLAQKHQPQQHPETTARKSGESGDDARLKKVTQNS